MSSERNQGASQTSYLKSTRLVGGQASLVANAGSRFDADAIIYSVFETLPTAKISLGRLDGDVA